MDGKIKDDKTAILLLFLTFIGLTLFIIIGDAWRYEDWFSNNDLAGSIVVMFLIIGYITLTGIIMTLYQSYLDKVR